jgi:hypothetical protein
LVAVKYLCFIVSSDTVNAEKVGWREGGLNDADEQMENGLQTFQNSLGGGFKITNGASKWLRFLMTN